MRTAKRKNIRNNEEEEEAGSTKKWKERRCCFEAILGFLKDGDVAQKKKKLAVEKKNLLQIDIPARKQTQS